MAQIASAAAPSLPYVSMPNQRRHASKYRLFVLELSQALFDFVVQLLPTAEELVVKEDVRRLLERLIRTIEPESRLLSFGSTANGFSLRNSDMDLCCLIDSNERLSASDLVVMLGDLLDRETKFHVKPLPHARIPIIKLSLDPSPGLPSGIACDIGFENRLALENTRLLMCYAMIDPTRVRTLVLFLKIWSKRRKINSPYHGTLSSYGYVLLVIYFLIHVKNPPVLPNLQQIPPLRPISEEDTHISGYNTWFFDDIELLCQRWQSSNIEVVAELLIDFFRYYARDFSYNTGVASIRAGLLKKESKGWQNDLSNSKYNDSRERNRFCIEDPFEIDYNVARCVTKEGLYQIRGEFMRASRILAMRPRAIAALSHLCEEKIGDPQTSSPTSTFVPPRLSVHPQVPNTAGSSPTGSRMSPSECLSVRPDFFDHGRKPSVEQLAPRQSPPEHMAPKRTRWTSPPPPEAPHAQHVMFENRLGHGLALATSHITGGNCNTPTGSVVSPGTISDEEGRSEAAESDDVHSTLSFSGDLLLNATVPHMLSPSPTRAINTTRLLEPRGRPPSRPMAPASEQATQQFGQDTVEFAPKADLLRRSHSGPPIRKTNRFSWPSASAIKYPVTPLRQNLSSASTQTVTVHPHCIPGFHTSTVFYETTATSSLFPHITPLQSGQHNNATSATADSHHYASPTSPHHLQNHVQGLEPQSHQIPPDRQERQGLGMCILEHKLSSVQLSPSRLDNLDMKIDETRTVPAEHSMSQLSVFPRSPAKRLCDSSQSTTAMIDSGAYDPSPDPRSPFLSQRSITGAGLGTTLTSPSYANVQLAPTSHMSDPSTPSSVSQPPSPPPTISSSNLNPHTHEECLRCSSLPSDGDQAEHRIR